MAEKTALENFLTCPVCLETFKEPVSLGCNHSFCRSCLENYWDENQTRKCPVCRRKSSKDNTFINFAINELCKSLAKGLTADSEKWRTMDKDQLTSELHHLKRQRQSYCDLERTYEDMVQHCKKQAVQCERQIRAEFERLHSFLQEEEDRALSALREEHQTRTHNMGREINMVREKLNSLCNSIQELERELQRHSCRSQRLSQSNQSESSPETRSPVPFLRPKVGLLLDQAKIMGNLGFRVWSNIKRRVSYSPVILDPNTANEMLHLSEDLRTVRQGDTVQKVPDNPERFSRYTEVLGSEGFSSGNHQWDVEVGDHPHWAIGVAKESVDRKGERNDSPKNGIWALRHYSDKYTNGCGEMVPVQTLKRLRVKLDYDLGKVSFYDAEHMTHLYTHNDTFTEKLFPFFWIWKRDDVETKEVRICPSDSSEAETSGRKITGAKPPPLFKSMKD